MFADIPVLGHLITLAYDCIEAFRSFFDFCFNTPLLEWVDSLSQGDNWIANLFITLLDSVISVAFGVFNIPSDTTIASFFLVSGIVFIFALWLLHFFSPFG